MENSKIVTQIPKDVLISEDNLFDLYELDLKGMEATLKALDMDTTPEELPQKKKIAYKICKCGSYIQKNHPAQYRCGLCGCIIYDKTEV